MQKLLENSFTTVLNSLKQLTTIFFSDIGIIQGEGRIFIFIIDDLVGGCFASAHSPRSQDLILLKFSLIVRQAADAVCSLPVPLHEMTIQNLRLFTHEESRWQKDHFGFE